MIPANTLRTKTAPPGVSAPDGARTTTHKEVLCHYHSTGPAKTQGGDHGKENEGAAADR